MATVAQAALAWEPPNFQVVVGLVGAPSAVVGRPEATPSALVALHLSWAEFLAIAGHCQKKCRRLEVVEEI